MKRFMTDSQQQSKHIQSVEVESDNGTTLIINGASVPKVSELGCYHDSFDQAHQHLLQIQETKVSELRAKLEIEEELLHELYPITESDC